jgi:uncharacterized protein (DUF362 family)
MRKRRLRWLCILVLLSLLLGARTAQYLALPSHAAAGMSRVAIVRTAGGVEAAVREAIARSGGLSDLIGPGDVVAIKVNLVRDAPASSGIVTDPAVARAVVRLAREAGAGQVLIVEGTAEYGEGDANRDRFATRAAFRVAGYDADGDMVDDATGAPLIDLNDSGGTDVADPALVSKVIVPTGLIRKEYWLPNAVLNADVLISVPVLKNHYLAGVTLGMKNLIGLLPADLYHGPGNIYGKHSLSHDPIDLDQHIVDLNLARRPDLVVVDGQRGMIDGPTGSQIVDPPLGLVMAGRDVVAVDTVGSLVMGYDPLTIPYLQMATQNGLGQGDTGHIRVAGQAVDQVRRDFPAPYSDSPARRADAQPPTVALVRPESSQWQGIVTIVGQAGDNDRLVRLELYVDEQRVGEVLAPPFEFTFDTGQVSPGRHLVRLVAFDRSLNQSSTSRKVDLALPAPPPTNTPLPAPTDTPLPPPTDTPLPLPTDTPLPPPTDTPLPPTRTASPTWTVAPSATAAAIPPVPTAVQPSATALPSATRTEAPPAALTGGPVAQVPEQESQEPAANTTQGSQKDRPTGILILLAIDLLLLIVVPTAMIVVIRLARRRR